MYFTLIFPFKTDNIYADRYNLNQDINHVFWAINLEEGLIWRLFIRPVKNESFVLCPGAVNHQSDIVKASVENIYSNKDHNGLVYFIQQLICEGVMKGLGK